MLREESVSQRVARNGMLYFLSLALPALTAVFLVPVTVRALGAPRFGLLALAWAVAEGSGMFDFGLARTTVRFVADATVRGADRMREIVLTALVSQTSMGVIAGALLYMLSPLLVNHVFKISPAVVPEATATFRVVAFHIPVLLALSALRATLEGAQRFDISSAFRVPGSLASVAVPAIAAVEGASLPTIMWILLAVRIGLGILNAVAVNETLLPGRWGLPSSLLTIREMMGYSGWVAVSAALGPALGSLDRFVVGAVAGVAALGYYTGAAEAATRFLLIPATAFTALLPALARTEARGARDRVLAATRAARRQLALLLFPLCLGLFAFAPEILRAWLGPAFSAQASSALRILSLGVFVGGLAHLPLAVLYGAGRPDLPAKIHIGEVLVHIPLTFALVGVAGSFTGAAAWGLRGPAGLLLFEWAARRALGGAAADDAETTRVRRFVGLAVVLGLSFAAAVWMLTFSLPSAAAVVALASIAYAAVAWSRILSDDERRAWLGLLSRSPRIRQTSELG